MTTASCSRPHARIFCQRPALWLPAVADAPTTTIVRGAKKRPRSTGGALAEPEADPPGSPMGRECTDRDGYPRRREPPARSSSIAMSRLATCPRCKAFVQPGWAECKICGYGPAGGVDTRPAREAPVRDRPTVLQLLGALATLAVIALLAWGAFVGVRSLWNGRDGADRRQELVVVPR